MTETSWPSAQQITAANGQVIKSPDGTISVYTINPATGQFAPQFLTKSWCDSLGISGAFFDTDTQKCRWSGINCDTPFNVVLNPRGNDGSVFSVYPDETCTLSIDFDYLFKFDCTTLTELASGIVTGSCNTIIDVFESIGASAVIDVAPTQTSLTRVFEQPLFDIIGSGNLYNYISGTGINTGFFICGELVKNTADATCYALNLYDLNITGDTLDCGIVANQLITQLFFESGLSNTEYSAFTQNVNANAFGANWLHFHTEITDPVVISAMTNQKIKLSIKVSGSCVDTCVLVDNIVLNQNCTKVTRTDLFLTQSPGFDLDRIRDNKKSWISNDTRMRRTYNVTHADSTNPIRHTDYYLDNSQQTINTKEIDLDLNIAEAVETDVWGYISSNPCLLTGVTVGTTLCVKDAFVGFTGGTVVTSSTIVTTGLCCPVTAITAGTIVTTGTSTTYSCPVGYSATPANDSCQKITVTGATFNGAGAPIVAGTQNGAYANYGAFFYPNIQTNGALPVFYTGNNGTMINQTGGTITALNINNIAPFWGNPLASPLASRLNNVGLSASSSEYLGFTQCINISVAGTYYIGIAADNLCKFYVNGTLIADFNLAASDNFKKWSVFPFSLKSGKNIIQMLGENSGGATAFGAEIYNPINYATLTGATSTGSSGANVIFSTADYVGQNWQLGSTVGYSCPVGYSLDGCAGLYTCTQIQNTSITAVTAVTSTTVGVTGYCTNITCVTYTVTSSTSTVYGTTTTTGTTVCGPQLYCCSQYCGDADININGMMSQPLTSVTTIEDFEYFITSELIDAKDRQTISAYPTLRLLYDRYLSSTNFCNTSSAQFDYYKMDNFANLVGNYWVDIIEQVIPATTLWGSTKIYTNTIFDGQKFKYRSYSTLFGYDGSPIPIVSSPALGVTCGVSATTTVIEGISTDTALFFSQGEKHEYSNVYAIQMNSGSEFVGTVNILGPNGSTQGNNINETTLVIVIQSTPPTFNQSNGTLTAIVYGAYGPVQFTWSNGQTSQTITNLPAGDYSVTVVDPSNGNRQFEAARLSSAPCAMTLATSTTAAGFGISNGTATITPSGGVAPYTYLWSNGQTTQSINGLSGATYTVTVNDSNSCSINANVIVTTTPCSLTALIATISSTGNTNNGQATVTASGGTPGYTYLWSNGQTTQTITSLSSATYTCVVSDTHACQYTASTSVGNVACILSATISTVSPTGNTSNGQATVNVLTGFAPYTYSWTPNPVRTTQTITALSAGTYTVVVTDLYNCKFTASTVLSSIACTLSAIASNTSVTGVTANGTATVTPVNGSAPFTYSWTPNPVRTTQSITGLTAGTYTVVVTDFWSCKFTATTNVTTVSCVLSATVATTGAVNSGSTGTATATPVGGTAPYTYSWNTTPAQTTQTATGLSAKTYTVVVTDFYGCTASTTGSVVNIACTLSASTGQTAATGATANGTATINASGGNAPYTYSWNTVPVQTTATAIGLTAGTYVGQVFDISGCHLTVSATVSGIACTVSATTSTVSSTGNTANGKASVTGNTGFAPYTYLWTSAPSGNTLTSQTITGITGGTYVVTITDLYNCKFTASATVSNVACTLSASTSTTSASGGTSDGTATVTTSGGFAPFTYSWNTTPAKITSTITGLSAGTYIVVITDNFNCKFTTSAIVTNAICTLAGTVSTISSTGKTNNGQATANPTNGTAPYTFSWNTSPVRTTQTITGLSAATYSVTMTDFYGCQFVANGTVGNVACTLGATTAQTSTHGNLTDGTATVTPTAGTPPYTYLWNTSATVPTITNLSTGTYTCVITDFWLCKFTASTTVTNVACTLSASASHTNATGNTADGTATANPISGTAPFTYLWNTSQTTQTITGLAAGTYSVTISDAWNCHATASTIVGTVACTLAATATSTASINNTATGTATANPTGAFGAVTYSWNTTPVQTTQTATGLVAGLYQCTIRDAFGCQFVVGAVVPLGSCTLSATSTTISATGNTANGSATVTPINSAGPYTYAWSNGGNTPTITNVAAGTYSCTITDKYGCQFVASVTVPDVACTLGATSSSTPAQGNLLNGTATATPTAGTSPFTYSWNNGATTPTITGLGAGTYTCTITDHWNCHANTSPVVGHTPCAVAATTSTTAANNNHANGTATATPTAGTAPFTYSWNTSPAQTTQTATGLVPATYNVTVTDAWNCQTIVPATVANIACTLGVSISSSENPNKTGALIIQLSADATGGTLGYTYLWSDGETTQFINPTVSGVYTVTVTDAWGCTATASFDMRFNAYIFWEAQNNPSPSIAQVNYSINGSPFTAFTTTISSGGYVTAITINGLKTNDILRLGVRNGGSTNVRFSQGFNAGFTGTFCGISSPYAVTISASGNIYLNVSTFGSGPFTLQTC